MHFRHIAPIESDPNAEGRSYIRIRVLVTTRFVIYYRRSITITITFSKFQSITITFSKFQSITITLPSIISITSITINPKQHASKKKL